MTYKEILPPKIEIIVELQREFTHWYWLIIQQTQYFFMCLFCLFQHWYILGIKISNVKKQSRPICLWQWKERNCIVSKRVNYKVRFGYIYSPIHIERFFHSLFYFLIAFRQHQKRLSIICWTPPPQSLDIFIMLFGQLSFCYCWRNAFKNMEHYSKWGKFFPLDIYCLSLVYPSPKAWS